MAAYVAKMDKFPASKISEEAKSSAILQRVAKADQAAVKSCIDAYGNLVWALAKKFTASQEEAETATQEIFLDIWKYAASCDSSKTDERTFIVLIAYRRLIKASEKSIKQKKKLKETLRQGIVKYYLYLF